MAKESDPVSWRSCGKRICSPAVVILPLLFFYPNLSRAERVLSQQYIQWYFGNRSDNVTRREASVEASEFWATGSLLNQIPMIIATVCIGPYSDIKGRKLALLLPCLGCVLSRVIHSIVMFGVYDVRWIYVCQIIQSLSGGLSLHVAACTAYVADVIPVEKRSQYMILTTVLDAVGEGAFMMLVGRLIDLIGFLTTFFIITAMTIMLVPNVVFMVPETASVKRDARFSIGDQLVAMWRTFFGKDEDNSKWKLKMLVVIMCLISSFEHGPNTIIVLYLVSVLGFSASEVGVFTGMQRLTSASCMFLIGAIGYNRRINSHAFIMMSIVSAFLFHAWFLLPLNLFNIPNIVFAGPILGAGMYLFHPMIHGLASSLCNQQRQGALATAMGLAKEANGRMFGSVFGFIYAKTALTYPQTIFCVACAGFLVVFLLEMWIWNRSVKEIIQEEKKRIIEDPQDSKECKYNDLKASLIVNEN